MPFSAYRERLRRPWLAVCLAALLASAAAQAASPRIVAVADVHGDLTAFKGILAEAGVIDAAGAWAGRDSVLVQLGDLVDRGPAHRGVLDFVMALEAAAAGQGGQVVALLGNHEVMNIAGDLRYVTPANFAEYADTGSEKRRQDAWVQYLKLRRKRARAFGQPPPPADDAARQAFLDAHPPGLIEHRQAFAPDGKYGRWMRGHRALFSAQGIAFLHGGVSPAFPARSLEEIEKKVRDELSELDRDMQLFAAQGLVLPFYDLKETSQAVAEELALLDATEAAARTSAEQAGRLWAPYAKDAERRKTYQRFLDWGSWAVNAPDGPLWFRGYSQWSDEEGAAALPRLTAALGVRRFVVGHTPQAEGRIRLRFGGAVALVDTGMLTGYVKGGRPSALEIAGDALTAVYPGGLREPLTATPPAAAPTAKAARLFLGADGKPLPFTSDDELLAFLREAPVVKVEDIGSGITHPRRLTLEKDGLRARAVFRQVKSSQPLVKLPHGRREIALRDDYGFEPAAYRLDRLLRFGLVPPATLRTVDGNQGSVQLWIEKAMTEERRRKDGVEPPEKLRWKRQQQMMLIWDDLVGNTDRNQGNYLYTADWGLWLIDHTRCFRRSTDLPDADRIVWCDRAFWERLKGAPDTEIRTSLGDGLAPEEVDGLLERRRKLVATIDALIRERGEDAVLFAW